MRRITITAPGGLENLTNLTNLSLFSNHITKLGGVDAIVGFSQGGELCYHLAEAQ